ECEVRQTSWTPLLSPHKLWGYAIEKFLILNQKSGQRTKASVKETLRHFWKLRSTCVEPSVEERRALPFSWKLRSTCVERAGGSPVGQGVQPRKQACHEFPIPVPLKTRRVGQRCKR
ncbi:hypothetical protein TNCV_2319641, partial [Trichonephila clavipes]